MIPPDKLTAENGFVDCCVCEVEWTEGFKQVGYFPLNDWGRPESEIISIRPLTGPMAIWNHAPVWATWCREQKLGIEWWDQEPMAKFAWERRSARPFWATAQRREE